ncbi:MAG: hypothetical protein KAU50_03390 [Candidatus Marinimicrobia bacterium]|nr:hypothetical protein [Candidatus Neomarinimicrobiota bacterium]
MLLFKPGNRTYILSALSLIIAVLLQGDAQGVYTLAPLLRITLTMALTIMLPLVPVFIRKAIAAMTPKARLKGASRHQTEQGRS